MREVAELPDDAQTELLSHGTVVQPLILYSTSKKSQVVVGRVGRDRAGDCRENPGYAARRPAMIYAQPATGSANQRS